MNENESDLPTQSEAPAPPPADSPTDAPAASASSDGGEAKEAVPSQEGGDTPRPERGERRRKKGRGKGGAPSAPPHGGGHGPAHHGHGGGPRYIEDRIDVDAEQLARETRYVPANRIRPLASMTTNVRRLLASFDPHDRREARRSLVLFKSRIAYLAGRESGRERNAFARVREFVLRGIEQVTRDREHLDPLQVRNFLDHVDAYVGYHRFHCDDRRRD